MRPFNLDLHSYDNGASSSSSSSSSSSTTITALGRTDGATTTTTTKDAAPPPTAAVDPAATTGGAGPPRMGRGRRPSSSSSARMTTMGVGGGGGGGRGGVGHVPIVVVPSSSSSPPPRCSTVPAVLASFTLRRRLLLSTFVVPIFALLAIPPSVAFVARASTCLALGGCGCGGGGGRGGGGGGRWGLVVELATVAWLALSSATSCAVAYRAISRHAPDDVARDRAMSRMSISMPFWSTLGSIAMSRATIEAFGRACAYLFVVTDDGESAGGGVGGGWDDRRGMKPSSALLATAASSCHRAISVRLGRNFTSGSRFLDMIADWLDGLSAPSTPSSSATTTAGNNDIANDSGKKTAIGLGGVRRYAPAYRMKSTPLATVVYGPDGNDAVNNMTAAVQPNSFGSSENSRYSRPGLSSILVQVGVNAVGGHIFARAFVLPHLGRIVRSDKIIVLSCLLVPIFELFSGINEAELNYRHYNSILGGSLRDVRGSRRLFRSWPVLVALFGEMIHRVRLSVLGATMLAPLLAAATVSLWSRLGPLDVSNSVSVPPFPSYWTTVQSLLVSYVAAAVLLSIMAIQDVLTRWAVCAPGMDPDVLMFQARSLTSRDGDAFLAEDLIIQSVLMGDGCTVDAVINPPGTKSQTSAMMPRSIKNHQEDEILRNEMATASFSDWIERSSTVASGKLSDDILRMCILESLGGGGSASPAQGPFYFGHSRHAAAIRKRLDLSAATSSPGRQPIAVPIVRALCAFAGGVGDAMSRFYRQIDEDGRPLRKEDNQAELWKLPPGSLHAAEYSIIAAARVVVMNSVLFDKNGRAVVNSSKRHDWLSLLLPCVLQSAYKLNCGINKYAEATARMCGLDLSTYDKTGKEDGLACYIVAECSDLCPVISACKDSAKMAMKTLIASGDRSFEDLLLRRKWKDSPSEMLEPRVINEHLKDLIFQILKNGTGRVTRDKVITPSIIFPFFLGWSPRNNLCSSINMSAFRAGIHVFS
ncbi:hypothetical protein ACHAW5_000277 [Stephanodiscus triporus]|uniref:Uncharacterized protein n=1 Tax=Stephanodiscus triporus TaxID=2934178 RepID=A0ABD3MTI8_9STRA